MDEKSFYTHQQHNNISLNMPESSTFTTTKKSSDNMVPPANFDIVPDENKEFIINQQPITSQYKDQECPEQRCFINPPTQPKQLPEIQSESSDGETIVCCMNWCELCCECFIGILELVKCCSGNSTSFKTLGYSFRISDVTVGRIVKETCIAIWDHLSPLHMPFPPTDEQQESIKEGFWRKWKFPSCVGCIDGKHIRIRNPHHSGSMFRNYKHFFSTVLQGVAGPDYKFITIDTGEYDKESDGGVFSNSRLYRRLEKNELGNKRLTTLPGSNIKVPRVLLGDEAYPLKTYLMRPFPALQLGPSQTIFNKRLSQARKVIECAFGIISAKWRVLQKGVEVEPNFVDDIVKCICLLHNIIIDKEGEPQPMSIPQQSETSTTKARFASLGENRSVTTAYVIRDKFTAYFCEHEANT